MAILKQGALGAISGKVGPIVGSSWKGKAYIRSMAFSYNDANTEEQQMQRQKFGVMGKFVAGASGFVKYGFKSQAKGMTECNAAMSYNVVNAIGGTFPNYKVDFASVLLSKGSLAEPYAPSVTVVEDSLVLGWTDNSGVGNADANDFMMYYLYNSSKGNSVYNTEACVRSATTFTVSLPSLWSGDSVEVYIAFRSHNSAESSNSLYLGSVNV